MIWVITAASSESGILRCPWRALKAQNGQAVILKKHAKEFSHRNVETFSVLHCLSGWENCVSTLDTFSVNLFFIYYESHRYIHLVAEYWSLKVFALLDCELQRTAETSSETRIESWKIGNFNYTVNQPWGTFAPSKTRLPFWTFQRNPVKTAVIIIFKIYSFLPEACWHLSFPRERI